MIFVGDRRFALSLDEMMYALAVVGGAGGCLGS
jgi:hypothetical protein